MAFPTQPFLGIFPMPILGAPSPSTRHKKTEEQHHSGSPKDVRLQPRPVSTPSSPPLICRSPEGRCFVEPTRQPWPLKGFPGALSGCFTKRSVGEQGWIFIVGSAGSCHTSGRPQRPGSWALGWVLSDDTHGVLRQAQKVVLGFFLH